MPETCWILGADVRVDHADMGVLVTRAEGTRLTGPKALAAIESARAPISSTELERLGIDRAVQDYLTRIDVLVPAEPSDVVSSLDGPHSPLDTVAGSRPIDALVGVTAVDANRESACVVAPEAIRASCPALQVESGMLFDPVSHRTLRVPLPLRDFGNLDRRTWLPTLVAGLCRQHRIIVLGGDHTLTWYALAGLAQKVGCFQLVHFDAHSDCSTAVAADHDRLNHASVIRHVLDRLPVRRLIQVGVRAYERHDTDSTWSGSEIVRTISPTSSLQEARLCFEEELDPSLPLAVSVDLDVLDPSLAPDVSHPVPGGMTLPYLTDLLGSLETIQPPIYLDLVEVSASTSTPTTRAAGHVLTSVLLDRHATAAPAGLPGLSRA